MPQPGRYRITMKTESLESRLLYIFAGMSLDGERRREAGRLMDEGPDWEKLLSVARQNEADLFLYRHLRKMPSSCPVQGKVFSSLEKSYHANAHRNLRLSEALGQVLTSLKESGLKPIVLKGAALLGEIYEGLAVRRMADVDLLIPVGKDREKAHDVLCKMGYGFHGPEGAYWKGEDSRFRIELHTRLMVGHLPFFFHEDNMLWERAEERNIAGTKALVLCPEDFILHLCLHAVYRHFFKLKFFIDIAECLNVYRDRIRWNELLFWDSRYPIGHHTFTAMALCRSLLRAPVPGPVLDEMRLQSPGMLTRTVDRLDPEVLVRSVVRQNLQSGILYLMASRTSFDRRRYLREVVFPPRVKMASLSGLPIKSRRLDLCYLTRPFSLFGRDALPALHFLFHR